MHQPVIAIGDSMTEIIDRLKLSVAAGILGDFPRHPLYVMEDRFAVPVASGSFTGNQRRSGAICHPGDYRHGQWNGGHELHRGHELL